MEIRENQLYISYQDVVNVIYYGNHIEDEEVCDWGYNLEQKFPIFEDFDHLVNAVTIPNSPRAIEVLEAAMKHHNDTRDELEKLILQCQGLLPPDPPSMRQMVRSRSRAISNSPNVFRIRR